MNRRSILGCLGSALLLGAGLAPAPAAAEFTPTRPIEIAVHGGPGSGNDLLARQVATIVEQAKLAPVRIQVSNKTGGGSTNASAYLLGADDPHTIGIFTSVWVLDPLLQQEATTRLTDLTPISLLMSEPALVIVKADSPFQSLGDFVNAAKEKPGEMKQSGGSNSSRENVLRQQIMDKTGTRWSFISFPSGGERVSALLGGHVDMMIVDPGEAVELVRAEQVRVLAQVGDERLPAFKDIPTLIEAGYDIPSFPQIRGVVGPPNMPADVLAYYEGLMEKVTQTAEWQKYIEENHLVNEFRKADESRQFLVDYENEVRRLLTASGTAVVR